MPTKKIGKKQKKMKTIFWRILSTTSDEICPRPGLILFWYLNFFVRLSDEFCPPLSTESDENCPRFRQTKSPACITNKALLQPKQSPLLQQTNCLLTCLQQQKSRFSNKKHLSNEEKCHVHECMCERENIDWIVELLIISNHKKHLTNKGKLIVYDSSEKTAIWSLSC